MSKTIPIDKKIRIVKNCPCVKNVSFCQFFFLLKNVCSNVRIVDPLKMAESTKAILFCFRNRSLLRTILLAQTVIFTKLMFLSIIKFTQILNIQSRLVHFLCIHVGLRGVYLSNSITQTPLSNT